MSLDLATEMMAASDALTRRHRERLAALGLTASVVARCGGLGIARVMRRAEGSYEPAERDQGETALIWPVWTGDVSAAGYCEGEIVDLLAWHPDKPEAFHRRSGAGVALGLEAIERVFAGLSPRPLPLYRSPLAWARAGGACLDCDSAGAVILDWSVDNGLFGVASIVAEDLAYGEEIEHRLKLLRWKLVPKLPEIVVPKSDRAQAG